MRNILIQIDDVDLSANSRVEYIISYLNAHPLKPTNWNFVKHCNQPSTTITYGKNALDGDIKIPAQKHFFLTHEDQDAKGIFLNPYDLNGTSFFSAECTQSKGKAFIIADTIQFDIFETLFFHITRYEEIMAPAHANSESGWLCEDEQILIKNKLQETPVVDLLITALFDILQKTVERKTTYSLSHDVDFFEKFTPYSRFLRSQIHNILRSRDFKKVQSDIRYYLKMVSRQQRDPYDVFDQLLLADSRWQDKTLYLMSGGQTKYDNHYKITNHKVQEMAYKAKKRGYTIGIHPSYDAGMKSKLFSAEKEFLQTHMKEEIHKSRQHWLRFDWAITPYLISANGIEVDSSMGYRHHLGFRCGTGYSYFLYDFKNEKPFTWLEQPLCFMDSAFIHHCRSLQLEPIQYLKEFFQKNKFNTHITINFHNSNFDSTTDEGKIIKELYHSSIANLTE